MSSKLLGHVITQEGAEIEVWTELGPNGEYSHLFIMYDGAQLGDCPPDSPCWDDELHVAACTLVADGKKRVELPLLVIPDELMH